MLYDWAFNDDDEFGRRTRSRNHRVIPETCDRERNSFVQRFCLDVDAMRETIQIRE